MPPKIRKKAVRNSVAPIQGHSDQRENSDDELEQLAIEADYMYV